MSKGKGLHSIKATPHFNNGDIVRDIVTQLEGVIVATTVWMNGCIRYLVQPQELKDGKPVENTSLDEQQLELVAATPSEVPERLTGGDRDDRKATYRP